MYICLGTYASGDFPVCLFISTIIYLLNGGQKASSFFGADGDGLSRWPMNSSNENEMYKKRKQQEHQAATKKNQKPPKKQKQQITRQKPRKTETERYTKNCCSFSAFFRFW